MSRSQRQPPARDNAPVAARYRVRYRKTGRLRFASGRDFQRALERAIRRGGVPVAYSSGFSPHPRISYTNTVATGAASEAEYFELGLVRPVPPEQLLRALSDGLPAGFEVVEVVRANGDDFAARLQASSWEIELPGVSVPAAEAAVAAFLSSDSAPVERVTKRGNAVVDARAAVTSAVVASGLGLNGEACAILQLVVRHLTPSVRPVDVLTALERSAGLAPSRAPMIRRLAQGFLSEDGITLGDPFGPDRLATPSAP